MTTETQVWGEVDGRTITFPFVVRDWNVATLMFSVPSDAAATLLPGDAFQIIETGPGTTQLVVALADYRDNPWGDYNEVNLGFLVHPVGRPEAVGSFVYRMPVDQEFTCKAGNAVMGFPKTVERIDYEYADDSVRVQLAMGGFDTLTVAFPRAPQTGTPGTVDAVSYSYLDGVPLATEMSMQMGTGFVDPSQVVVEVGDGPVADELRSLGLPKPPDMCVWGEHLVATFQLGRPV